MSEKAAILRKLHAGPKILVLPNAWDVASARIFETAGFPAIATTSAGVANSLGYPDGQSISRDEMLDVVRRISRAVAIPVTADMESGYGDALRTALGVVDAGAVGMNLEDCTEKTAESLIDLATQCKIRGGSGGTAAVPGRRPAAARVVRRRLAAAPRLRRTAVGHGGRGR